ncbi:putative ring-cleaving dioxygenase MhqO [Abditibacteriota bacterium]|nr:putative ring-cleaving dioxygenase MhqO [Abditibacteriota bacterium]
MSYTTSGLHHMTAITSDPQRNVDFYTEVLGFRLVKLTVNFDDPSSYHFYYGDTRGTPGTILTFFSWPGANRAKAGRGVVETTHLRVPVGSLAWWSARLADAGVETTAENDALQFTDFDGLRFELVEEDVPDRVQTWNGSVPAEYAIGGMKGISLRVGQLEPTAAVLEGELGFQRQNDNLFVASATGDFVRLLADPTAPHATTGSGGVHHIAFRSQSEDEQREWLQDLRAVGFRASPVMDRDYFRSIYFREPNGVLFEIATDAPGFTIDEPLESLGHSLKLPAHYESHRAQIESRLAPVRLPEVSK